MCSPTDSEHEPAHDKVADLRQQAFLRKEKLLQDKVRCFHPHPSPPPPPAPPRPPRLLPLELSRVLAWLACSLYIFMCVLCFVCALPCDAD
jgi:hypothetical protein